MSVLLGRRDVLELARNDADRRADRDHVDPGQVPKALQGGSEPSVRVGAAVGLGLRARDDKEDRLRGGRPVPLQEPRAEPDHLGPTMGLEHHVVVRARPGHRRPLLEEGRQVAVGIPEDLGDRRFGRKASLHQLPETPFPEGGSHLREGPPVRFPGVRGEGTRSLAGPAAVTGADPFDRRRRRIDPPQGRVQELATGRRKLPFGRVEEVEPEVGKEREPVGKGDAGGPENGTGAHLRPDRADRRDQWGTLVPERTGIPQDQKPRTRGPELRESLFCDGGVKEVRLVRNAVDPVPDAGDLGSEHRQVEHELRGAIREPEPSVCRTEPASRTVSTRASEGPRVRSPSARGAGAAASPRWRCRAARGPRTGLRYASENRPLPTPPRGRRTGRRPPLRAGGGAGDGEDSFPRRDHRFSPVGARLGPAPAPEHRVVHVANVPEELGRVGARLLEAVEDQLAEEARAAAPADAATHGRVQVAFREAPNLVRDPIVARREPDHHLRHGDRGNDDGAFLIS